jgi:hypothetical protein
MRRLKLNHRVCLALASIVIALLPALAADAQRARQAAGFSCGPNMVTYLAKWQYVGRIGDGIRCVLVNTSTGGGSSVPKVIWYGEGAWDNQPYRHLAEVFTQSGTDDLTGDIEDIFGNGEVQNETGTVTLHVVQGSWPAPAVVDISSGCGCWTERWFLVQSLPYTPLKPPKTCGSYLAQYTVSYGNQKHAGMRCAVRLKNRITMWLGRGTMDGLSYTQLGYRADKGFGAADLCGAAFGTRCQTFPAGSIKLVVAKPKKQKKGHPKPQQKIVVSVSGKSGAWTETWVQS